VKTERKNGAHGSAHQLIEHNDHDWAFMMYHLITKEHLMPTYHIEMFEGRTPEQKKKLVEEITRVTVEVLGGSPESVDIIITDIQRANWATGGKLWSEPRG
jgi:4-oxalocrotonate tautomerase